MIKITFLILSLISLICAIILIGISAYRIKSSDNKTVGEIYPLHKKLLTAAHILSAFAAIGGIIGMFLN